MAERAARGDAQDQHIVIGLVDQGLALKHL
jgi:hypothetical protein